MPSFMYKNEKIGGVTPKQENIAMGNKDISSIGDGTLTGAINAVNENKLDKTANAASASKLSNTSAIGSATKPVYFNANGVPVAGTYELNKSVPSDAKFTDTTYPNATTSTAGLMSASDKSKLNRIACASTTMETLGLNGKTSSVADFFNALTTKGYAENYGVLYFAYGNAKAGSITGSGITIPINGCQCIIVNHNTGVWQRRNAIISMRDKTYNVWAQYDNSTTPSESGIFDLTSANKLNTNAGSDRNPVYFADGIPKACSSLGEMMSFFGSVYSQKVAVHATRYTTSAAFTSMFYASYDSLMYKSTNISTQDVTGLVLENQCDGGIKLSACGGRIFFDGNTVSANTSIATASDPKIKNFTKDIENDEDKLIELYDRLIVKSYKLKSIDSNKNIIGLNAEDVEIACNELEIDPEKYNFIRIDYNYMKGSEEDVKYYTKFRTLSYNDLFVLGILKNKKMEERVDSLESRLVELEERMGR